MTFSAKIRWYLLGVALLPPLIVLSVLVIHVNSQIEVAEKSRAVEKVQTYEQFRAAYVSALRATIDRAVTSPDFQQAVRTIANSESTIGSVAPIDGLDFLEVIDPNGSVVVSMTRPGMVGETMAGLSRVDSVACVAALEYDRDGAHPAFAVIMPVGYRMTVYAGRFLTNGFLGTLRGVVHAELKTYVAADDSVPDDVQGLSAGEPRRESSSFLALLEGGKSTGFYLVASLPIGEERPAFLAVIRTTAWVTVFSTLIALGLGFYLSWQTRREIRNLIEATARVANGDLSTAVMSFEEGEFAALADSFSRMVTQLKESQGRLAATQTIAAWQTMGRKIAHEVKNPLTPIAICADDLRRSYQEGLPGFEKTLEANTRTIKNEVARLTHLLDEFSRFARMAPPHKVEVELSSFLAELRELYAPQMETGQIVIADSTTRRFHQFDPHQIKQVLINCLKNSLEANAKSHITITLSDTAECLECRVEDTGPGFSPDQLAQRFEPYLSSKRDGSGLGLVICQRIIIDHGGTIDMYNLPERGAGVKFTLPKS